MIDIFSIFKRDERLFGTRRSSGWRKVRKEFIKGKVCAVCGGSKDLEVHHIVPFNINPARELDPKNLIVLCDNKKNGVRCHLWFGHLGNYMLTNRTVRRDAKRWNIKIERAKSK